VLTASPSDLAGFVIVSKWLAISSGCSGWSGEQATIRDKILNSACGIDAGTFEDI
jgi:hypothetical protein